MGWWAISGDLPTTFLPAAEIPDPRAFLRIVSERWQAAVAAMERGELPEDMPVGPRKDWPHLIPLLRYRASMLEGWAEDDDAWDE